MKKYVALSFALILCTVLFSFSNKPGGDVFEIYFNGKQVLQQFVHASKGTKTLQLTSLSGSDKIEVVYSHCGQMGKNRVLAIRNEKNELLKELKFADDNNKPSPMSFYRKDVPGSKNASVNLYYYSKELPEGRLLTIIQWRENKAVAKL